MAANRRRALAVVAAAAWLAACGGGDGSDGTGGGSPAAQDTGYLPLAEGNRWFYSDGSDAQVVRALASNATAPFVWVETVNGSMSGQYAQSDATGVRFSSPGSTTFPAYTQTVIRNPVTVGDRYPSLRLSWTFSDADNNGTLDHSESLVDAEVVGFETVDTPAGRFDAALHLRFSQRNDIVFQPAGTRQTLETSTADVWYAQGVGPVRRVVVTVNGGNTTTETRELTGYRVGGRTGGVLR